MAFITIELKTNDEGGTAATVLYSDKDIRVAEQHYHTALADAATSGRPHHAGVILDSDGNTVAQYGYANEVTE